MMADKALSKIPVAVFASGNGTNLQRLLDLEQTDATWPCKVVLVVSDRPTSNAVSRAVNHGVAVFAHAPKEFPNKAAYESAILARLVESGVEWLILAGYMRLVGNVLLNGYAGRILNIHPSLLPEFPGLDAIGQAMRANVNQTGVTVHYVDEGLDTGEIIAQQTIDIPPGITEAELETIIHSVEHVLYPEVIQSVVLRDKKVESGA